MSVADSESLTGTSFSLSRYQDIANLSVAEIVTKAKITPEEASPNQFLSEALLNLWRLTPNPNERIRLQDIYDVIAEEFPNLSWSAFRMSVRRQDPSLFKHPFLYGSLIHKDDVYRAFIFSNCSTIDNEKTIAIVGTAGQRLMNEYRNAALIEEISFGIGDQSFTVPEVDSESSPPSATRKKLDTLYFLCEKVISEWNNVDVDSNLFFEFGGNVMDRIKVDLLESQQRVGNESWSIPVNDVLLVCYLSKTIYFKGLSVFLSKIYVREFRRKSLLTCAAVICTLQAQLRYRGSWSSAVVEVLSDVINTFFSRFSNWFEILRMILMNENPPSFFQDVLIKSHAILLGAHGNNPAALKAYIENSAIAKGEFPIDANYAREDRGYSVITMEVDQSNSSMHE